GPDRGQRVHDPGRRHHSGRLAGGRPDVPAGRAVVRDQPGPGQGRPGDVRHERPRRLRLRRLRDRPDDPDRGGRPRQEVRLRDRPLPVRPDRRDGHPEREDHQLLATRHARAVRRPAAPAYSDGPARRPDAVDRPRGQLQHPGRARLRRHGRGRRIDPLPDVQLQHLVRPLPVRAVRRLRGCLPRGRHPHGRRQPAEDREPPAGDRGVVRLGERGRDDPRRGALHPLRTLRQAMPVRRHYDGTVRAPGDLDGRPALQGVVPGRAACRHARRRRRSPLSFLERVDQSIRRSSAWRSLFRQPYPNDERSRAYAVMNNVFLHIHPVRVRQHAVKFAYTFCLGGLSFFLFLVLTITGVYLMFFYVPSATLAYTDILNIQSQVTFGLLTRNIHRWAAHLMVFFVFLHMMRVFYHG